MNILEEKISIKKEILKIVVVILASIVIAININSFVEFGEIIPGGFTGITILLQRVISTFFNINVPFLVPLTQRDYTLLVLSIATVGF